MESGNSFYELFPDAKNFSQTKMDIFKSAIQLFAKSGYSNTSTNQIAKTAGISEALIFRYFKNKKGILQAIIDPIANNILPDVLREFSREILHRQTANLNQFLNLVVNNRIKFFKANFPVIKIYISEILYDDSIRKQVLNAVPRDVYQDFNDEINYLKQNNAIIQWDNNQIFRFIFSNIFGYLVSHYVVFPNQEWNEKVEVSNLIDFLARGLDPVK